MFKIICFIIAKLFVLLLKIITFYDMSVFLSRIPFLCGNLIRYNFYKATLSNIGDNVRFGPYCSVGLVDFGNNVLVAQSVHFLSGSHQHGTLLNGTPMCFQPGRIEKIKINDDVWIGAQTVVMTDIPRGCVIGAGSVVINKLLKENCIYAGNPAKLIKERSK